ncbi:MAG: phospholipase [Syntrophus sp. (in: bacteria)]|nr:phospholipase [Syntrophus sp. (in: bacteria)]
MNIERELQTEMKLRLGTLHWVALALLVLAASSCATFPSDYPRTLSVAFPSPQETMLGRQFEEQTAGHDGKSGFHLIETGTDALAARVLLADKAEKTLDLQSYIIRNDESTVLLMDRVIAAAERNVRVRILLDDMGRDFKLEAFARHPNIEVRLFNPFLYGGLLGHFRLFEFAGDFKRLNRRMHNKAFIIDNAVAIVGGRNLGNEYFSASADVNLVDLGLLVIGPVVKEISESFDAFWNSDWAIPVQVFEQSTPSEEDVQQKKVMMKERLHSAASSEYARAVQESHLLDRSGDKGVTFILAPSKAVYDQPSKILPVKESGHGVHVHYGPEIEPVLRATQRELTIISPYFVPNRECIEFFKSLLNRGVHIRLLTNSLASTDVPSVHTGYARRRPELLRLGVDLFELKPSLLIAEHREKRRISSSRAALHAKAFVVDRRTVYIGSMNFDPRSTSLNTELGLIIESEELAGEVIEIFNNVTLPSHSFHVVQAPDNPQDFIWTSEENGREVRYTREPLAGFWRRVLNPVLSVFVPESLL